jgi:hypothetical protein
LKRIIIGGSGSTGSSVLNNILGRNSSIASTIETSLFCKRELYQNFNKNKWRINLKFPFGLRNHGYHLYRKTDVNLITGLDPEKLNDYINSSHGLQEFSDKIFLKDGKSFWVEKTPANSYNFDLFIKVIENSHVIHTVRNPYDALTSLILRGHSGIYAAGIYLLNTLSALNVADREEYTEIRYEELTGNPGQIIGQLFKKLKIPLEGNEIIPREVGNEFTNIDSWNKSEIGPIEKNEGRFRNATPATQQLVSFLIESIYVSKSGAKYYNIPPISLKELVSELGYKLEPIIKSNEGIKLRYTLRMDRIYRLYKLYLPHFYHYPLAIIK